ncbi:hypothetical protein JTM42_35445, partial [Pseudomonas aeruginosa]|nr:hypothetical protein [Pseudomonas aeruginosa]
MIFQAEGHKQADAQCTLCSRDIHDLPEEKQKELRKALREAREDKKALAQVNADKNTKIDELAAQLARKPLVVVQPMDEQLAERREELATKATAAEAAIA